MKKIRTAKPKAFRYAPFREFKVVRERLGTPAIVMVTGNKGRTKRKRTRTGNYYVMYWRGDYLKLDKLLKWLSRAVAYVDSIPDYDFKTEFETRSKRWNKNNFEEQMRDPLN